MPQAPLKTEGGFTLIEIITILILLGILGAIAFSKTTEATKKSKDIITQTAVTAARNFLQQSYNDELLSSSTPSIAWANTVANIPENCGVDDQDFTVICTESGDLISITATGNADSAVSGGTATGNFTNPASSF